MERSAELRKEYAKFWRAEDFSNLELLRAHYITHSFSRHFHEEYAIGVVDRGAMMVFAEGNSYVASADSLILLNPGDVHQGHAAQDNGWTYRMFYPNLTLMRQIAFEMTGKHWHLPYFAESVVKDRTIAQMIRRFHYALETSTSQLERDIRLRAVIGALISRYAHNRPDLLLSGNERHTVRRAKEYLENHFSENTSLKDLATMTNLSPYHLVRVFRKQFGLPPHTYLTLVRVEQAKRLLKEGESIADVAYSTGFSDQSHLTRWFKRIIGVSPGQYAAVVR